MLSVPTKEQLPPLPSILIRISALPVVTQLNLENHNVSRTSCQLLDTFPHKSLVTSNLRDVCILSPLTSELSNLTLDLGRSAEKFHIKNPTVSPNLPNWKSQ